MYAVGVASPAKYFGLLTCRWRYVVYIAFKWGLEKAIYSVWDINGDPQKRWSFQVFFYNWKKSFYISMYTVIYSSKEHNVLPGIQCYWFYFKAQNIAYNIHSAIKISIRLFVNPTMNKIRYTHTVCYLLVLPELKTKRLFVPRALTATTLLLLLLYNNSNNNNKRHVSCSGLMHIPRLAKKREVSWPESVFVKERLFFCLYLAAWLQTN